MNPNSPKEMAPLSPEIFNAVLKSLISRLPAGFSIESVATEIPACNDPGCAFCCPKQAQPSPEKEEFVEDVEDPGFDAEEEDDVFEPSNLGVELGQTTQDTAVYVAGHKILGVSRVEILHDAELGFPVLKLEILNPEIL